MSRSRIARVLRPQAGGLEKRYTADDYASWIAQAMWWQGMGLPQMQTTLGGQEVEVVDNNFVGLVQGAYKSNGPVFACMLARLAAFAFVRFRWQRLRDGSPSDKFGTPSLRLLERPWVGGTTQDLCTRIIQDADLAGNFYATLETPLALLGSADPSNEIVRLRPDWVDIVVQERQLNGGQVGWKRIGYLYYEGGRGNGDPVPMLVGEVAHYAPLPDPLAAFRGMSWLTPVIREVQGDKLMEDHKSRFFANGATPNMVVKYPENTKQENVKLFAAMLEEEHAGVDKAYKTLHTYPGADVNVIGANMKQIDFKVVQGAGETRIAAAAGVPPVIVGLSEGLQAATYSNYSQARRRFADITMHPLWGNAAGSLEVLLPPLGSDVRLWYDADQSPFLREDATDRANIQKSQSEMISTLSTAGFTPESVIAAILAEDWRLLVHTGLYSVQLQPLDTPPPGGATQPQGA